VANVDRALERLKTDHAVWARKCAKIVNKRKQLVPLELRPWQHRFQEKIAEQRLAEKPIRGIILKARQLGFSTDIQATFLQEATLNSFEAVLTVAHDLDTAGKLFDIGHRIYHNLPDDPRIKPQLTQERNSKGGMKYMQWANGSTYDVETAGDKLGGRGTTPSKLHLSEIAHYRDEALETLLGLLNGVPDTPTSMIFKESTANGRNHFERDWNDAVQGISGYFHIFVPWWEEPEYSLPFYSLEDREAFEDSLGEGEIGEDELMLLERFPHLTLEQLNWRRFAIRTKTNHDPVLFKQEYPAYPEEAFKATGRHVFSIQFTSRVLGRIENLEREPDVGILRAVETEEKRTREGSVDVPTKVEFVPIEATGFNRFIHPTWSIWRHPVGPDSADHLPREEQPIFVPGQYVIGNDVAGEEETTSTGDTAYHALQVIDHVTKAQAARWRGRIATHELTYEAVLAAVYFNNALLAVEITGGWGGPIARNAWRQYGYANVFRRQKLDGKTQKTVDVLGWATDTQTRPEIIGNLTEQLAEGTDGIFDPLTADELTTFVYNEKGKPVPEADHFSDLIMALMIAKFVARIRRPRPNRRADRKPVRPQRQTSRYR
jgi:hypothetical protein